MLGGGLQAVIQMPDWWGLSFAHTLLALALLLFLVDIFFQSDVPTHISYVLVSAVVATEFDVHPLWQAVIGVLTWFALVGFHYLLWRRVLTRVAERLAPSQYLSGAAGMVGEIGRVKEVDGRRFVALHGDLWRYDGAPDAPIGAMVRVLAEKGGRLVVEPADAPTTPKAEE